MTDLRNATTAALMDELLQRLACDANRFASDANRGPLSSATFALMRATERCWTGLPKEADQHAVAARKWMRSHRVSKVRATTT